MLHALIRVVQYSVVFYFKIDQKMLFFTLLTEENVEKRSSKFSDFGQNAKSQFWPIFMPDLWKLKKI